MSLICAAYLLWRKSPRHVSILWLSNSYIWTFGRGKVDITNCALWCHMVQFYAHHRRLVIAMEDVDEVCNRQHTCDRKDSHCFTSHSCQHLHNSSAVLPTNLWILLSHKGAALKPLATIAKKAFFTLGGRRKHYHRWHVYVSAQLWVSSLTCSEISKMTSLQLVGMAS